MPPPRAHTVTLQLAGTTCTFEPRPIRYLRITQTHNSANSGRHLVEVMAFAE